MHSGLRARRAGNSPSPQPPVDSVQRPTHVAGTAPLLAGQSAESSEAGTSSSLGGTKQWLDDVLSASLRRHEVENHKSSSTNSSLRSAARPHHRSEPRNCFDPSPSSSSPRGDSSVSSVRFSAIPAGHAVMESCGSSSTSSSSRSDDSEEDKPLEGNSRYGVAKLFNRLSSPLHNQTSDGNNKLTVQGGSRSPDGSAATSHHHRQRAPRVHNESVPQRTFSIRELLSLYHLLDGDSNGIVTTQDLFGFLSLHPQAIDLTVETFYRTGGGGTSTTKKRPHGNSASNGPSRRVVERGDEDMSIPALIPHAGISLLSSCSRGRIRDPELYQKFCRRRFRRGEVPLASDLLGPTWWVHHRLRAEEGAQRFVSFVLLMTSGLAGAVPSTHVAVTPAHMGKRGWSPSPGGGIATDAEIIVPHVTFFSFQQLYYHCAALLRSPDEATGGGWKNMGSHMFAALDLPMLRKLMWFYEYLDIASRSSGRQWDWMLHHDPDEIRSRRAVDAEGASDEDEDNRPLVARLPVVTRLSRVADARAEITVEDAQWVQGRFHHVQELLESSSGATQASAHEPQPPPPVAPQPLYTSLPAVYWTFAAWDIPRGWFDVSVLQRLGERYMRYHTIRHARVMRQFLRQMWVSQHSTTSTVAQGRHSAILQHASNQNPSRLNDDHGGTTKGNDGNDNSSKPAAAGGIRIPPAASVAEKLALVQLSNRFLSFHQIHQIATSSSGSRGSSNRSSGSRASNVSTTSSATFAGSGSAATLVGSGAFSDPGGTHGDDVVALEKSTRAVPARSHRRVGSSTTIVVDANVNAVAARGPPGGSSHSLTSLVGRVARDGVNALWETMSNASTQASPHRPLLRRATWRHQQGTLLPPNAAIDAEEPRAQPALAVDNSMQLHAGNRHRPASTTAASVVYQVDESNNTAAVETVIRQSLLHHDLTLHSILAPDMTLSAIPSMSGSDRIWLRRETRQLIVRAAVYALISAMLISVVDVMAQAWILEEDVSFLDTSTFANFEDFFSFTGFTSSSASSTTTAANGTATVTTTTVTTPLMTIIKYHVAVVIGTLVFSLVEVLFLYLDTLQFCFKMAQTCGIPLEAAQREHHQHSSHHAASVKALKKSSSRGRRQTRWDSLKSAVSGIIDSMAIGGGGTRSSTSSAATMFLQDQQHRGSGGPAATTIGLDDDNRELRVIRQHLVRRRVRFMVAAIARCAMQIQFDPTTVLGVDVRDRNASRIRLALSVLGERLKRVAPSVILRLVATKLLNRMLVPFVAVPVMVAWNIVLTRRSIYQARLVSLGTIGVERIARELLSSAFQLSARVVQHNARLGSGSLAGGNAAGPARSSSASSHPSVVQVPSSRPLFHVPFHCLQEVLMLVIFFCHVVHGAKEVHPFVHSLLVELLSSSEFPDVCLWMLPKVRKTTSSRRRGGARQQSNIASTKQHLRQSVTLRDADGPGSLSGEFTSPLQHDPSASSAWSHHGGYNNSPHQPGPTTTVSEALSPPRPAMPDASWNKVLDLALLDVGGSAQCALSATLRTFTRELNRMRAAVHESSTTADWLHLYVEACPWPADLLQRVELRDHIKRWSILHPGRVDDARFEFLLQSTFLSWASPSSMGPSAHQRRRPNQQTSFSGRANDRQSGAQAMEVLTPSKTVVEIGDGTIDDDTATAGGASAGLVSDSDCTVELEHAAASDALRSATTTSPFSLAHIKMFLTLGILLVVTTFAPSLLAGTFGASPGPSSSRALVRFLLHLRSAYLAALRNSREFSRSSTHANVSDRTATPAPSYQDMHPNHSDLFLHNDQVNFLRGIDNLQAAFWAGSPCLNVADIHHMIDMSTPRCY